ncbi:MAG: UbiA prenyltransferase family protein [Candidatus Aenigmarchaeota archaeon]|nr:UbiA prenyltransferase family protein [Candidatus Aenigmarchaeota archaeon]
MLKKIRGVISLSRWKEVFDSTIAITLASLLFAGGGLGSLFFIILFANLVAMTYAFMINDVEDAVEDSKDIKKRLRNPICNGSLTRKEGLIVSNLFLLVSLSAYAYIAYLVGSWTLFLTGAFTLLVFFLYSYRGVRLKNIPVLDMLTHMYMLGGAIFLITHLAFSSTMSIYALVAFMVILCCSGYGQLENELRDFSTDKKCGMRTTAIVIGKKKAKTLEALLLGLALLGVLFIGASLENLAEYAKVYLASFAIIFAFPLLRFISDRKFDIKRWFQGSLVISLIATAVWILYTAQKLVF